MKKLPNKINSKFSILHLYRYSLCKFAIKTYKSTVNYENNQSLANVEDTTVDIKQPLGMLLGVLGACEAQTMGYQSRKDKIQLDKIDINLRGEYDIDVFLGKKQERNTFTFIDIEINVHSKESDKKKLSETIEKAMQMCPVANTLRLAGIKMNEKINYI